MMVFFYFLLAPLTHCYGNWKFNILVLYLQEKMQVLPSPFKFICLSFSLIYCCFWLTVVFICTNTVLQMFLCWHMMHQDEMWFSSSMVTTYWLSQKLIYQLQFVQMDLDLCIPGSDILETGHNCFWQSQVLAVLSEIMN